MKAFSLVCFLVAAGLSASLSAQTSVSLNGATIPASGAPGVDVNVDVSFPAGQTATLRFVLVRGGVDVGATPAVPNLGGPNQDFRILITKNLQPPPADLPKPQAGDTLRAEVVCSNGQTATSTHAVT